MAFLPQIFLRETLPFHLSIYTSHYFVPKLTVLIPNQQETTAQNSPKHCSRMIWTEKSHNSTHYEEGSAIVNGGI